MLYSGYEHLRSVYFCQPFVFGVVRYFGRILRVFWFSGLLLGVVEPHAHDAVGGLFFLLIIFIEVHLSEREAVAAFVVVDGGGGSARFLLRFFLAPAGVANLKR